MWMSEWNSGFAIFSACCMECFVSFGKQGEVKAIKLRKKEKYPVLENIAGFPSILSLLKACLDNSELVRPNIFSLLIPGTKPAYLGITPLLLQTGVFLV